MRSSRKSLEVSPSLLQGNFKQRSERWLRPAGAPRKPTTQLPMFSVRVVFAVAMLCRVVVACESSESNSGAVVTVPTCAEPPSTERRHPGVYDYESCNACHTELVGGWVYSNAAGDAWVENATVTLSTNGQAAVTAKTAVDGFFLLNGQVGGSFTPCVEKCGKKTCANVVHSSADCQSSSCHGAPNKLINVGATGAGAPSAGNVGAGKCHPPASGGPRMHYPEYDGQTCANVFCHGAASGYIGGYVYDGIASNVPVSMATLIVTPQGGAPISAVTGPGGMFQIKDPFTAPYTACVSKCPDIVCSSATSHTNTEDCSTCHTEQLRIHLP